MSFGEAVMSEFSATYIGIIDGLHTWEVRDQDGNIVGTNQSADHPQGE
jgi:hypothetical protein